jgi:two-component sensor histidine kinase
MFHPHDQDRPGTGGGTAWRPASPTRSNTGCAITAASIAGPWVAPCRCSMRRAIARWIGTCTDIDAAKRAAEENELLSRELSHRIKNIFAVISGLIGLSSRQRSRRSGASPRGCRTGSRPGRAHEFARPHSERSRPALGGSTLHGLLAELFTPYPAFDEGRIVIVGRRRRDRRSRRDADRPGVPRTGDQRGQVRRPVAIGKPRRGRRDARRARTSSSAGARAAVLRWPVRAEHTGFGTRLAEMSVENQLGGSVRRTWSPEGLQVEIEVLVGRLNRDTSIT